jgi:hypothetical protein
MGIVYVVHGDFKDLRREEIMDFYEVITEQIESCLEQRKEIESGREDNANFLKLSNTLLTINSYIKILDECKYADPQCTENLKNSWKELLQNVKAKLSAKLIFKKIPVTQI